MQTSLHIMSLVAALAQETVGGQITSTEFYKKERAAYLFIKHDKQRFAMGFRYHPAGSGVFLVPASKIRLETKEKPRPLFGLSEGVIVGVEQMGFDRIFALAVESSGSHTYLMCEALGPNGNLWHLDESRGRLASLRKKTFTPGEPYEPPALPDKMSPRERTVASLRARIEPGSDSSTAYFLEKQVLGFNRTLAREVVVRAGCDDMTIGSCDDAALERLISQIEFTLERFKTPSAGYLYESSVTPMAHPFRLKSVAEDPTKFKTLSLATLAMCDLKRTVREEADDEKRLTDAVARYVRKLEKRLASVEADLSTASDFERYKKYAELLQINYDRLKSGLAEITVDDIYFDPPRPATIRLEEAITPRQNIEAYFRKYRKGRDGVELLQRRLEITSAEIASARRMAIELESDFETARQRYEQELAALAPAVTPGRREVSVRLPFREYLLSTGLKLLVGREGADNDRTTFEYARPYELWFHAQQCPGSHVVMKFPNKSFEPSRAEIEEAAAVAAYHSKARKNSLVPVVYTQRKHVRKPRKAKPGLVTVEREKSLMVAPQPPRSA